MNGKQKQKLSKSIICFTIAKGLAFLAPILFLKFVSIEEYGIVEYSYSMGSVISLIVGLGLAGAYPYFILKRNDLDKESIFYLYGIPAMLIGVVASILYHWGLLSKSVHFIILFTLIFATQRLFSSRLKSEDKGYLGVIADSGYYFILSCVIVLSWIFGISNPVDKLMNLMEIYVCTSGGLLIFKFVTTTKVFSTGYIKKEIADILAFSYKLIISGFIVYWLTSSSRIFIRWFLGIDQVGIYSFYFRMAGMSVIIYQFISIAFFKRLYIVTPKKMDTYYSTIIALVTAVSFAFAVIIPYVANFLNSEIEFESQPLYFLLCLQMPIWVGFALCESIIGRENIVSKFNSHMGVIVLIFPVIIYLMRNQLTLASFVFATSLQFFVAFTIQLYLLHKKGITLRKCMGLNIILCVTSIFYYLIFA